MRGRTRNPLQSAFSPQPPAPMTGGIDPVPGVNTGGLNYMGGSQGFNENTGMGGAPTKQGLPPDAARTGGNEMNYGIPVTNPAILGAKRGKIGFGVNPV